MKNYKFIGTFKAINGNTYQLTVYCMCFIQAFFLLTADAIRSGKHWQLDNISDENGYTVKVDDIVKVTELLT